MKKISQILAILCVCVLCFSFSNPVVAFASEITEDITTETSEVETDSSDDSHGGGGNSFAEEDKNWLTDLLDGIFDFFFGWIIDIGEYTNSIITSLGQLFKNLASYTFEPIEDFIASLNNGAINMFVSFWDIPIVKEFSQAFVSILLVGGLFIFLSSL